jgi:surface polysaccharide O-acyltransferase-like enzyme
MDPSLTPADPPVAVPVSQDGTKKLRQLYPNYIRAAAAFGVVQMHSIGEYLYRFNPEDPLNANWMTADVFYSFLRWCTPFFVMLSGSFMLSPGRDEPIGAFLKKRVSRVMIPFAFWVLVYLLYGYRGELYFGNYPTAGQVLYRVFFEDTYYQLWFIPMIVGMYFLTPMLRLYVRQATQKDLEYFLVLSFIITTLQLYLPKLVFIKFIGWLGYVGFYILGYYLITYRVPYRKLLVALALALIPVSAYLTWWATVRDGSYYQTFFIYHSPNVVLLCIALFTFLRYFDWAAFAIRFPRVNRTVEHFSKVSFGVYFIHIIILDVLKNGYIFNVRVTPELFFNLPVMPWFGTVLQATVIAALSAWSVTWLVKIPFLRKFIM